MFPFQYITEILKRLKEIEETFNDFGRSLILGMEKIRLRNHIL